MLQATPNALVSIYTQVMLPYTLYYTLWPAVFHLKQLVRTFNSTNMNVLVALYPCRPLEGTRLTPLVLYHPTVSVQIYCSYFVI